MSTPLLYPFSLVNTSKTGAGELLRCTDFVNQGRRVGRTVEAKKSTAQDEGTYRVPWWRPPKRVLNRVKRVESLVFLTSMEAGVKYL